MYADHERPGPIARLLCRIFGHTHEPRLYLRPGKRSVTDGIGRLHINVEGECARCERVVEFGQLHVPNGPWLFDHAARRYVQARREGLHDLAPVMASWDAEHPHPVTIKEVVDADAQRYGYDRSRGQFGPNLPPDVGMADIDDDMAERRVRFARIPRTVVDQRADRADETGRQNFPGITNAGMIDD